MNQPFWVNELVWRPDPTPVNELAKAVPFQLDALYPPFT
jgi:hypothetical protein